MVKIFYKNKLLILSDEKSEENLSTKINFLIKEDAKKAVNVFLSSNDSNTVNIYGISMSAIEPFINEIFIVIKAAGGIVSDSSDRILFIKRLGYWDLPKGKLEAGEETIHAGVREVCEECGIMENELSGITFYKHSYHIYPYKNAFALKETSWYLMNYNGSYNLTPQLEEDITEIVWVYRNEINTVLNNTYPSLVELFKNKKS